MKLHFEPDLDYQLQAIEAVCGLFQGQETCRTEFTVTRDAAGAQMGLFENDLGIGNRLTLLDDELLANLHAIQLRHGLAPSPALTSGDFTVEMETGTGKTYVYLRTVFELNKRYGFTKFVIIVPSVAIKEGVYHTIETAAEHLKGLYAGAPFDYFLYDSAKLGQVRNFATSPQIQIMVMTVGAINKFGDEQQALAEEANDVARREKSKNVMYRASERTGGEKPIDLIRATHPILIVDEPQSVEGGLDGKGRKAMERMNPLCNLRYSATPKEAHHMVFKLDAVDAYERKLVKQIEVAAASVEGGHNKAYVKFVGPVTRGKSVVGAKVELDVTTAHGVSRKIVPVAPLDKLEQVTGREIYRDHMIGQDIRDAKDDKFMELRYPGGEKYLRVGEAHGDVEPLAVQRQMIHRTIKEHLDKEMRLRPQGIKVLSLFFIDAVEKYRWYDADGNPEKGDYARIFEEEYRRLAKHPDYQSLLKEVDLTTAAAEVHNGYFSIDKKKVGAKTVEVFKDTRGTTQADDDTYSLIMRDKEKLLSFDTPLKFIFSHSALREGWDNPNVFQICALREMASEQQRRQTIGRGLRLCVNQYGDRLRGFEVNTLTVIATESYEQFAENLQKEIEQDTGIRFGIVEAHQFAGISTTAADGQPAPLGFEQSKVLWEHLRSAGLVNAQGKVQDTLRQQLNDGTLTLPAPFAAQLPQVKEMLRKLAGRLEIKNADDRRQVKTRQAVLQGADFKALWDRIKHKTTYRVEFDNAALLATCTQAIRDSSFVIAKTRLQWRKADLAIGRSGVDTKETANFAAVTVDESDIDLPDILTDLQDKTQLTRRSIQRILVESGRLDDFKRNPQQFIEMAAELDCDLLIGEGKSPQTRMRTCERARSNGMKVCIIGAGAIGGFIGTRLAAAGRAEVSAVARGATLAALREHGWRVRSHNALLQAPARATDLPQELGLQDLVIIAVKGPALTAVAQGIAPLLGAHTLVLPAMNGVPWWFCNGVAGIDAAPLKNVDPGDLVARAIPFAQVIGCVVHASTSTPEPGLVQHRLGQGLIVGEPGGGKSERVQRIADLLVHAGFDATHSANIRYDIWYKLWGNVTMNPVSAITGASIDRVLADPLVREFCSAAMIEAAAIGARLGCAIEQTPEDRHAVTARLGAFRSSMLQDVDALRPIELDAIVGAVHEIAQRLGIAAPNIAALLGLTRLFGRVHGLYPQD